MGKVLIADNVSEECARILTEGGIEVDNRGKMTQEELKEAIGDYEGLVVRKIRHRLGTSGWSHVIWN